mmetsp:Transcript_3519/g.4462  ORF Transcript_3519/g.4462 Transcript_3519/m.4462 type:complete len:99 (-) Transcript_3519:9-305(-)
MNIDHGVIGSETSIQLVPQAPVPSSVPPPATTTAQAGPVPASSRPLCCKCGADDRSQSMKDALEAQGRAVRCGTPVHDIMIVLSRRAFPRQRASSYTP